MNIAQITDIHIAVEGVFPNDIDVRQNFLDTLQLISGYDVDAVILTGDLCYKIGNKEVYQWIKDILDQQEWPYYVIAGNHDHSPLLAEVFALESHLHAKELYFTAEISDQNWIFLDTAVGKISDQQFDWLEQKIGEWPRAEQVFIAMHHPPVFGGVRHMDAKYALSKDSQYRFQHIIEKSARPAHVFCGHYHTDKLISRKNLYVHITPSCFVQIDPRFERFTAEHQRVGFRHIQLMDDAVHSAVHYVK